MRSRGLLATRRLQDIGERDAVQPAHQDRLGLAERLAEGAIDGALDRTRALRVARPDAEHARGPDRVEHVAQAHRAQIARDRPAAAVALLRDEDAGVAQPAERPAD